MAEIIKIDDNYKEWISQTKDLYRKFQIKAASSVNREMLAFFYSLGRDLGNWKIRLRTKLMHN